MSAADDLVPGDSEEALIERPTPPARHVWRVQGEPAPAGGADDDILWPGDGTPWPASVAEEATVARVDDEGITHWEVPPWFVA